MPKSLKSYINHLKFNNLGGVRCLMSRRPISEKTKVYYNFLYFFSNRLNGYIFENVDKKTATTTTYNELINIVYDRAVYDLKTGDGTIKVYCSVGGEKSLIFETRSKAIIITVSINGYLYIVNTEQLVTYQFNAKTGNLNQTFKQSVILVDNRYGLHNHNIGVDEDKDVRGFMLKYTPYGGYSITGKDQEVQYTIASLNDIWWYQSLVFELPLEKPRNLDPIEFVFIN